MLTSKRQGVGSGERKKRTLPYMGKRVGGNIDLWGPGGVVYMAVRGNARVCVYFALDGKFFGRLAHFAFKRNYFAPPGKHVAVQRSA